MTPKTLIHATRPTFLCATPTKYFEQSIPPPPPPAPLPTVVWSNSPRSEHLLEALASLSMTNSTPSPWRQKPKFPPLIIQLLALTRQILIQALVSCIASTPAAARVAIRILCRNGQKQKTISFQQLFFFPVKSQKGDSLVSFRRPRLFFQDEADAISDVVVDKVRRV